MKHLDLECLSGTWPEKFSGLVILGVSELYGAGTQTLWLLLEVAHGTTASTRAEIRTAESPVPEVEANSPFIYAVASRRVWEMIPSSPERFYEEVAAGKVQLHGDYRLFGRFTPALVKAIETTPVWLQLDEIIRMIAAEPAVGEPLVP